MPQLPAHSPDGQGRGVPRLPHGPRGSLCPPHASDRRFHKEAHFQQRSWKLTRHPGRRKVLSKLMGRVTTQLCQRSPLRPTRVSAAEKAARFPASTRPLSCLPLLAQRSPSRRARQSAVGLSEHEGRWESLKPGIEVRSALSTERQQKNRSGRLFCDDCTH